MSVDRLKRFFSKTVVDSKHDDTVTQSGHSEQHLSAPVSLSPQQDDDVASEEH